MTQGTRIAKAISDAGFCSRRAAERLLAENRVKCNGIVITTPTHKVNFTDNISIDDVPLERIRETKLWLYHKPVGLITTHHDPEGRPTIFSQLPKSLGKHVLSIGRLDINSEGLLLLTNSGELARYFELPSNKIAREYRVRCFGQLNITALKKAEAGLLVDGINYRAEFTDISSNGSNHWLTITLREGKNREIRKIMEYFNLKISRLIRTRYGDYRLGDLAVNKVKEARSN